MAKKKSGSGRATVKKLLAGTKKTGPLKPYNGSTKPLR